ncbi:hypothetical protein RFI_16229 [Reticulomyxa filosa]|uniref:Thioredoxin domain-containing protein n=1 Tax=Reticulomyxa filosa TaxID=46433 RepID=X6N6P9_RETFI|nr:hypothetical protein RFI_16229 [Reticulomyxa filosa]|eukprot:ETO20972.1 hypothetical protein RFI_16229 [Reticulomyxa filosa]
MALFLGIITVGTQQFLQRRKVEQVTKSSTETYGDAAVASKNWEMFNHEGKLVNHTTYTGKYQIVYFGFTFCPDVCPRELTKLARALQILEAKGYADEVVPIFVSVDPKRDSPALVAKFIRQFHPKIVGLTGTPHQVATFTKAYRAYYSTPGPTENQEDYIIDQLASSGFFLFEKNYNKKKKPNKKKNTIFF